MPTFNNRDSNLNQKTIMGNEWLNKIQYSTEISTVEHQYPRLLTRVNLNPAWMSNYIHYNVWVNIIYPFSNDATVDVWEWISNFTMIIYSSGIKVNPCEHPKLPKITRYLALTKSYCNSHERERLVIHICIYDYIYVYIYVCVCVCENGIKAEMQSGNFKI